MDFSTCKVALQVSSKLYVLVFPGLTFPCLYTGSFSEKGAQVCLL